MIIFLLYVFCRLRIPVWIFPLTKPMNHDVPYFSHIKNIQNIQIPIVDGYPQVLKDSNHGWKILEVNGALTGETASDLGRIIASH